MLGPAKVTFITINNYYGPSNTPLVRVYLVCSWRHGPHKFCNTGLYNKSWRHTFSLLRLIINPVKAILPCSGNHSGHYSVFGVDLVTLLLNIWIPT